MASMTTSKAMSFVPTKEGMQYNRLRLFALIALLSVIPFTIVTNLFLKNSAHFDSDRSDSDTTFDTHSNIAPTLPIELLSELKHKLVEARDKYDALIKEKYGQYADDIFGRSALLEIISSPSSISSERLKRRMKIKIIQAQLSSVLVDSPVTFTWVTSGNSVSAGHGNLHSQSYTSVLEAAIEPFFAVLGIKFYGKNYGMSAKESGPEAALCLNSLYGMDIDILLWDFKMTDLKKYWNYELWSQRAGIHPTKPILFSKGTTKERKTYDKDMESAGIATFVVEGVEPDKIPDSDADDINLMDLPSGLQYYKCSGHMESGDDICKDNKWNTSGTCPKVIYQVKWHPGWKYNQLLGYQLASYMVELISDALNELDASNTSVYGTGQNFESSNGALEENRERKMEDAVPSMSVAYLEYLLSLETKDRELFLESNVPQNNDLVAKISPEVVQHLFRANTMCHTSIIPSYARYEGLVTENKQNITYLYGGKTTYKDEGIGYTHKVIDGVPKIDFNQSHHPQYDNNATPPVLGFVPAERNICAHAQIDFKDSFIVSHEDNWMTMAVPNKAEKEALSTGDPLRPKLGLIMLCTTLFNSKTGFPKTYVNIPEIMNATSPMGVVVNDVGVTGSNRLFASADLCYILKHAGGYYFPEIRRGNDKSDSQVEYEIKLRVLQDNGVLYLSSAIVL